MYSSELLPLPEGPVITAASPGFNENETSEITVMGPRGVGYCLLTFATSSMSFDQLRLAVCSYTSSSLSVGLAYAVMLAHVEEGALAERCQRGAIVPQCVETLAQAARTVRLDQYATAGPVYDFDERAASRLNNRYTAGHRFEQKHTFRLVIGRGHRQHIEPAQELKLSSRSTAPR